MTPLGEHKKSRETGIDSGDILARKAHPDAVLLLGATR
jgi:hypothetical protein